MESTKQLRSLKLEQDHSKVHIKFLETITMEPAPGALDSQDYKIPHQCSVPFRPHKDLVNSLKKLRGPAIDFIDLNLGDLNKDIKEFAVFAIKITGDVDLKQSRVKIFLSKKIDKLGEIIDIEVPEIIMYPNDEEKAKYWNSDKVTPIIEDIIEEVWSLLFGGKFDETVPEGKQLKQLVLFPARELESA